MRRKTIRQTRGPGVATHTTSRIQHTMSRKRPIQYPSIVGPSPAVHASPARNTFLPNDNHAERRADRHHTAMRAFIERYRYVGERAPGISYKSGSSFLATGMARCSPVRCCMLTDEPGGSKGSARLPVPLGAIWIIGFSDLALVVSVLGRCTRIDVTNCSFDGSGAKEARKVLVLAILVNARRGRVQAKLTHAKRITRDPFICSAKRNCGNCGSQISCRQYEVKNARAQIACRSDLRRVGTRVRSQK